MISRLFWLASPTPAPDIFQKVKQPAPFKITRTIRYQFFNRYVDEIEDPACVNRQLAEYLLWYTIEKPQRGIKIISLGVRCENHSLGLLSVQDVMDAYKDETCEQIVI